ncbi:MAG: hypothetical protein EOO09_15435 [Chitinophagaceae bacterium]|nr:MAG: hypothetical protein EOO09_15435 [Chitinophagaceae bacterium]
MSRNFSSDQELIDNLSQNDTVAFEELYRRYWYSLYSYSLKKLESSDDARRIVRKIFIQLWENRHRTPVDFSISQHLYSHVRMAVVECLNERLNNAADQELIAETLLNSFTVEALEGARRPVELRSDAETVFISQRAQVDEVHPKYSPFSVKWLSDLVSSKSHS